VNINAIQQGTGEAFLVFDHNGGGAGAEFLRASKVSTRARLYRGNKLDAEFLRSKNTFNFPASMMMPKPGKSSASILPLRIHALICFDVTWQTCAI
jgi:hypothetical protein